MRDARLGMGALKRLMQYRWPGNVRELDNMVERAMILSGGGLIDEKHFTLDSPAGHVAGDQKTESAEAPANVRLHDAVCELEARLIEAALVKAGGNKSRAAALLDISERALWYKLKKYRPDHLD